MKEKIDLILLCISSIVCAVATLLVVFGLCTCACFGAEKQTSTVKKPVSQSTSRENAIRKQQFNQCVQSGTSRSKCYYLYY